MLQLCSLRAFHARLFAFSSLFELNSLLFLLDLVDSFLFLIPIQRIIVLFDGPKKSDRIAEMILMRYTHR